MMALLIMFNYVNYTKGSIEPCGNCKTRKQIYALHFVIACEPTYLTLSTSVK